MISCVVRSLTVDFMLELCADYRQMDIARKKERGGEKTPYI